MNAKALTYRAGVSVFLAGFILCNQNNASAALSDSLVSYWPMEEAVGGKTPDLVSGYDMTLNNLTAADLVPGKFGQCFSFSNAKQTLLSRVHGANDDLPANKNEAFTVSFWAKVNGTGQIDLRLFSEGFTPNNNTPLFNLGTHSTGADGSLDLFIRNDANTSEVNHLRTTAQPFDDTWHHVTFVQNADDTRQVYVDGVLDDLAIPARSASSQLTLNDTTIGGILRAAQTHWVTGLIDEVAIWKRALTPGEITQVFNEGLVSVFPPESIGLVAHWPMEEAVGGKTPDLVSGYDMTLNNLTAADLVPGKFGQCFSFSNAKQTLLSRVHGANDDLPANKNEAFTVSFWAKVNGTGQIDLRLFSEGFTPNNNTPLFNLGTHSTGADGSLDLFIRNDANTSEVNHLRTTAQPFDDTWHHVTFVQNADDTRQVYVDGVLDDLAIPARSASSQLTLNDTTIGGILRAAQTHWVTGLIDEVAIWKRALTQGEIANIMANGVPKVLTKKQPLELKSFTAEFPVVAAGDKVVLHWEGSKDANYVIDEGVGDVTAQTVGGTGSKQITVAATTTYKLTATRGNDVLSKTVEVKTVAGVAAGWHLLETFESLAPGNVSTQSGWLGAEGVFSVIQLSDNKALGYDAGDDLTALKLQTYSIPEGQKGTLSFKLMVQPLGPEDPVLPIGVHVGLTERAIRFNDDFNQNVGPYVRVERIADGPTIDVQARNGVATGLYEGQAVDAIAPGAWYRFWIDVENKPFDVVDGVQNGGDIYSVHIQKDGDPARTTLFESYVADRDAVTIDPALGAPTPNLIYAFIVANDSGQGVNQVLVDDFFISVGDYNATVPYVPQVGPTEITITGFSHDRASNKFTLTWGSLVGTSYNVQRRDTITAGWTTIATGYPTGGATGTSTSYSDDATLDAGFYRVVYQP